MRITSGMIQNSSMNALYSNMSKLNQLYGQMNTLKKIERPSDNPLVASKSVQLKMNLIEVEQRTKNIKEAISFMDSSETAMTNMSDIIKEIRTRCNQAANDTLTKEDRNQIVDTIEELFKQLQQEANSQYAGKFIFSGYKTDDAIFITDPDDPMKKILNSNIIELGTGSSHIKNQSITYEVGSRSHIQVNSLGIEELMYDISKDVEEIVSVMQGETDEQSRFFSEKLEDFDKRIETVSKSIAEIGSRQKRLEYTMISIDKEKTNVSELLSNTEGVDIEQVYIEFNTQYMVYQSALQASSRMIQNTLADYIR